MMDSDALYAACLLSSGPHCKGTIGDSQAFNDYYNRIYAWYSEHVFDDSVPIENQQWIRFYNGYLEWVGQPGNEWLEGMRQIPTHLHTV